MKIANTLASLTDARDNGIRVLSITNAVSLTMARKFDNILYTLVE